MTNVDTGNVFFSVESNEQPLSFDWLLTVPHSWHLTSNPSNTQLFQLTASLVLIAIISPTVCVMSANPPPPHISHKTQASGIVGAVTRPAHFNWITFILVLLRNPVNPLSRLFLINTRSVFPAQSDEPGSTLNLHLTHFYHVHLWEWCVKHCLFIFNIHSVCSEAVMQGHNLMERAVF